MKIVEAAGAVVLRDAPDGSGGRQVLAVHRPRYDDWSLPKGKLEVGELAPAAAVREVGEETLHKVRLLAPLDRLSYRGGSTDKQVSWWRGLAVRELPLEPDLPDRLPEHHGIPEVDEVAWLPLDRAAEQLDYDQDRYLIEQAADQPVTTPLIILRHAKAINRRDWDHSDEVRPLRPRGRVQARRLMPLLAAYGVQDLVSSPWLRCVSTLQPYALEARTRSVRLPILDEENGPDDPDGVAEAMQAIAERAVVERRPVAVCGHRPVLPHMLAALDVPERRLATAECVVVHLTDTGSVHAVELHRPRA